MLIAGDPGLDTKQGEQESDQGDPARGGRLYAAWDLIRSSNLPQESAVPLQVLSEPIGRFIPS